MVFPDVITATPEIGSDSSQADLGGMVAADGRYSLAERILARRDNALRAGLHDAADRLMCLAWKAYERAQ